MSLDKFISTEGYKANSPDRNNPYNIIQSGRITMKGVPHPVYGMDELGNGQMMYPGQEYMFPGGQVTEVPVGFHMMPDGQTMPNSEHPGYEEMELTDEEIEEYRKGGYIVEELDTAQKGKAIPTHDMNKVQMYNDSLSNFTKGKAQWNKTIESDIPYEKIESDKDYHLGYMSGKDRNHVGFRGYRSTLYNDGDMPIPIEVPIYKKPVQPYKKQVAPDIKKVEPKSLQVDQGMPTINTTPYPGIPELPESTIIGYTQKWDPVAKRWTQEPQYQVIAEPGMYAYGGDIQVGGGYNYNEINSLKDGGGIHIDPSKKGTFTAAATKHGKGVQEFASQVLANKENYSPAMVKKANFARNAAGWKKQDGGGVKYNTPEYNEAYKKGIVTKYDPTTDTYQGQNLPAFEISAKDTRVADAARNTADEFAQDYVAPVLKGMASFTPAGLAIGLTDAGVAFNEGDTFGGVLGAGMEVLPYGIGKGLKALKKSGALNKAGNTLKDFTQGKVIPEYGKRWKELTPTQQNEYVAEAYRKLDMKYGLDHPNAVNTSASYKGPESSDVIDMLVDRNFGDYHFRSTNDLWQSKVNNLSPEELKAFEKDYFNRDKILKDIAHANVGDEAISNIHTNSFPNPLEVIDKVTPMPSIQQLITLGMPVGNRTTLSPLNLMPGYGKVMKGKGQVFRKFGNSMADVQKRKMFGPSGGSKYRMGRDQIVSEGNWGNLGDFDEQYSGVFGAKVDPNVKGTNLGYKGWHDRNGVLITDSSGQLLPDVPISDPGLSFHRRLPFSNRYVTIDKQKLIDDKFQLATQLPYLQSLSEKYVTGLGIAGIAGGLGMNDAIDTYNDYTINPILDFGKKTYDKLKEEIDFKDGGEIQELTDEQIAEMRAQGYIVEEL